MGFTINEHVLHSPQRPKVKVDTHHALNFTSNDYNGFAGDEHMIEVAKKAIDKWGYGMASAPLMSGQSAPHMLLEEELAKFHGTE